MQKGSHCFWLFLGIQTSHPLFPKGPVMKVTLLQAEVGISPWHSNKHSYLLLLNSTPWEILNLTKLFIHFPSSRSHNWPQQYHSNFSLLSRFELSKVPFPLIYGAHMEDKTTMFLSRIITYHILYSKFKITTQIHNFFCWFCLIYSFKISYLNSVKH